MNILFVHQNFPGQFRHLATALVAANHRVAATTMNQAQPPLLSAVDLHAYAAARSSSSVIHPWVSDIETKVIRAEAWFHKARQINQSGFVPDLVIAHPGWGETLFIREIWPKARLGIYCEFFYLQKGADADFDPEFAGDDVTEPCRLRLKNANYQLHFDIADAGIAPTQWQASTFPPSFRSKISVIHDGIATDEIFPHQQIQIQLPTGQLLNSQSEVITFVNRNLEPCRGYHIFLRTLPAILRQRPSAQVVIVGGSDTGYGSRPPSGSSWKDFFIAEVQTQIAETDWQRVHFVGLLPRQHLTALFQVSTVHVYLTYPFVLGWSLLEAMSAGCAIVASDTAPVREAIQHNEQGVLVDFFDQKALAQQICALLEEPERRRRLSAAARDRAKTVYDLKTVCLPKQLAWIESLF